MRRALDEGAMVLVALRHRDLRTKAGPNSWPHAHRVFAAARCLEAHQAEPGQRRYSVVGCGAALDQPTGHVDCGQAQAHEVANAIVDQLLRAGSASRDLIL